jgi:hypothetical protein
MSDGPAPGEWQGNPAGRQQGFGEQPAYPGQPAGCGGEPAQQVPPGYGQPGYAGPGNVTPGYGTAPYGKPPPTYLIWARIAAGGGVLFNLILGFPAGLIAASHGRKVRQHWDSGNQQAAVSASRKARTWAILSTALDVLGIVLFIVIVTQAATPQSNFSNPAVVAASIKAQLQKRISDPSSPYYSPGVTVTSVTCRRTGSTTDRCVDHFSDGQTASEIAVISANGDSYRTH